MGGSMLNYIISYYSSSIYIFSFSFSFHLFHIKAVTVLNKKMLLFQSWVGMRDHALSLYAESLVTGSALQDYVVEIYRCNQEVNGTASSDFDEDEENHQKPLKKKFFMMNIAGLLVS